MPSRLINSQFAEDKVLVKDEAKAKREAKDETLVFIKRSIMKTKLNWPSDP